MAELCFLCGRSPISWPGTGLCEPCFQETAELAHQAKAEMDERAEDVTASSSCDERPPP